LFPCNCGKERLLGGEARTHTTRDRVGKKMRRRDCTTSQENLVLGESHLEIKEKK
jgi:hypothetical protein